MTFSRDDRVSIGFAATDRAAPPGCAWLIEGQADAPGPGPVARFGGSTAERHAFGCACCAGRDDVAQALGGLFIARASGAVPWFGRVLALTGAAGEAAIRRALRQDRLVSARFRLEG
ncbi:MAG: hypothetical protein JO264_21215 [Acidisphaera sp.]|nr:hypothetical protein [Acidisphaera sp.]